LTFLYVIAGAFGSLVGSFLNVIIYRVPRGMPWGMERSQCPKCAALIAWFDNIPLVSWIVLRARCRACKAPISIRYPAVELITALLFALCLERTITLEWTPLPGGFLVSAGFCALLVSLAWIDHDLGIVPDALTLKSLLPLCVLGAVVVPSLHGTVIFGENLAQGMKPGLASLMVGAVGAVAGFAILAFVGALLKNRKVVGDEAPTGDSGNPLLPHKNGPAKLAAGIGLLLGAEGTLIAMGIALTLAALVGGVRFLVTRDRRLPLAPYAAVGAIVALFYGTAVVRWLEGG